MYSFKNDYSEGAHPSILELLTIHNVEQETGYGEDSMCLQAQQLIQSAIEQPRADIYFVTSGSQANVIVLNSMVSAYESVIAPVTGHINMYESGALEALGHKINGVETTNGKLTAAAIQAVVDDHKDEHKVEPKVVYISQSTEVGTIYSKPELEAIAEVCERNDLYLYVDGARLGSALTCNAADMSLVDVADLVDAFYIGGTKNGALLGEAVVLVNQDLKHNFRRRLKNYSALLAKGRVLGTQFVGLFTNNLYYDLANHANAMANLLRQGVSSAGYQFQFDSPTNQIFPIFPNELITRLEASFGFYRWSVISDTHSSIRLVTSWATPETKVQEFIAALR